jgi:hypothetical protein
LTLRNIENGPVGIVIANEKFSALDIFLIYSKGEFFEEEKEAVKILSNLRQNPITSKLTHFQFYNYLYDVYKICAYLYALIRQVEKIFPSKPENNRNKNNICIFCRTKEEKFTFPEHVYPESLGNTEIILPAGLVCDACNNGVLSRLDTSECQPKIDGGTFSNNTAKHYTSPEKYL